MLTQKQVNEEEGRKEALERVPEGSGAIPIARLLILLQRRFPDSLRDALVEVEPSCTNTQSLKKLGHTETNPFYFSTLVVFTTVTDLDFPSGVSGGKIGWALMQKEWPANHARSRYARSAVCAIVPLSTTWMGDGHHAHTPPFQGCGS